MSDYARWQSLALARGIVPPENIVAPVISGTPTVGQVLTTTNGTWLGAPSSYTYQWVRGVSTNVGTSATTYTLVAGDSGQGMRCFVTGVNAGGSVSAGPSNTITVA